MLHLGCGAGFYDSYFKRQFAVTGVDISPGMLEIARRTNPDVDYHLGDMRNIELNRLFDIVAAPDCIDYMQTPDDLLKVMSTARKHLRPGGLLLIVAHPAEIFRPNNFDYCGADQEVELTVFENNYIPAPPKTGYEATLVYLIRRKGQLEIYNDCHQLGLFNTQTWLELFKKAGFKEPQQISMDHIYDRFVMDEGEYRQTIFIARCEI